MPITRTVVIPMYREQERLPTTLMALSNSVLDREDTEVLMVDDGSEDQTLLVAEHGIASLDLQARVIRLDEHRGKGAAVAAGVAQAVGAAVAFADADLSAGPDDIDRCLGMIEADDADLVVATRAHPDSTIGDAGPFSRQVWGVGYNVLLRTLRLTKMSDTQCGLKGFKAEAAKVVFADLTTEGFAFDIEILARAGRLGFRVSEMPVTWSHITASRVHPMRDAPRMMLDTLRVWRLTRKLQPMVGITMPATDAAAPTLVPGPADPQVTGSVPPTP